MFGRPEYLPMLSLARLMKGPSFCDIMLAVPSLTWRPEADVTGLAVRAVLGVLRAASMVPGRPPDCDPGLTTPDMGRPDCVVGRYAWLCPPVEGGAAAVLNEVPGLGTLGFNRGFIGNGFARRVGKTRN